MVSNLLQALGLNLGPDEELNPPCEANAKGFFEHLGFLDINEALLKHLGGSWDNPPTPEPDWEFDPELLPLADRAKDLIRGLAAQGLWGWKDPRTTILLPFWRTLVPGLRFVICLRDPLEVARSLARRDRHSQQHSSVLWSHYTLAALRDTRMDPRLFVFYEDLVADPQRQAARLAAFAGLPEPPPQVAGRVVAGELKHHSVLPVELLGADGIATECKLCYLGLRGLLAGPGMESRLDSGGFEQLEGLLSVYGKAREMERSLEAGLATAEAREAELAGLRESQDRTLVDLSLALKQAELSGEAARNALKGSERLAEALQTALKQADWAASAASAAADERDRMAKALAEKDEALSEAQASFQRMHQVALAELASWQGRREQIIGHMGASMVQSGGWLGRLRRSRPWPKEAFEQALRTVLGGNLQVHFDSPGPELFEGEARFTGWCWHPHGEILGLSLAVNGVEVPAQYGGERADVGAAFPHAPEAAHSGFFAALPLTPGRYLVSLRAEVKDLGPDRIAWTTPLVVLRRPLHQRLARKVARLYGFALFLTERARQKRLHGGFPSWREFPRLLKKALSEFRRGAGGSAAGPSTPQGFRLAPPVEPYDAWLQANGWGPRQEEELRGRVAGARDLPLISLVTPVYRPGLDYFADTAESVLKQVYTHWEWCLADDASKDQALSKFLAQLSEEDPRVRFVTRGENGHISRATNSAAELAQGEYLAFLDHDDLLSPDALAEVALYLAEHPDVDVLYTDDDKIDDAGRRYSPQFKPDWSPESLLSQMYLSHLLVIRRSLFNEVGGLRVGLEGSQDHDLALRVTEKARRVAHLPLVLYHWRAVPGSTAASGDAKHYSFEAGLRAVRDALHRRGVAAEVERPEWAVQAKASIIRHRFPDDGPSVAVLVATRNRLDLVKRCIESLKATSYRNHKVYVLDDHSDEPAMLAYLATLGDAVLRDPLPRQGFNFSAIHNRAARRCEAEYLVFLNDDTELRHPDWLSQLVGFGRLPGVGAVGARLLFPDRTIQHAGILGGFNQGDLALAFRRAPEEAPGYLAAARTCRNYSAVTAACMLTPRRLFLELGGFDEKDFAVSFNDVDYCFRLADRGYRSVYAPEAELFHHEGASRGIGSAPAEKASFKRRYAARREPYYNPNLSTDSEHFELRSRRLARRRDRQVRALMVGQTLNLTGAPYCQMELTLALKAQGRLDALVISGEDGPLRSLYEAAGLPVRILPGLAGSIGTLQDYEAQRSLLEQEIRAFGPAVVYGNTLNAFAAVDAADQLGLPSVWNIRESEAWQDYYRHLPDAVACRALDSFAKAYQVVFVSNGSRRIFEALNSRRNFSVIHDGLDLREWGRRIEPWPRAAAREALGIEPGDLAVLLLGTVCERKGQQDLARALALLEPAVAGRLRCFIVGDRPSAYSRTLAKLVQQLNPSLRGRVRLVPETREVAEYYQAADLFVCTSRVESYPRVTLEAMASGLPIISTPVFGLSEQLAEGVNALFYQPGDSVALAAALRSMALDPERRLKMGTNSTQVLAGLKSFDEMAGQYFELLREAAESR